MAIAPSVRLARENAEQRAYDSRRGLEQHHRSNWSSTSNSTSFSVNMSGCSSSGLVQGGFLLLRRSFLAYPCAHATLHRPFARSSQEMRRHQPSLPSAIPLSVFHSIRVNGCVNHTLLPALIDPSQRSFHPIQLEALANPLQHVSCRLHRTSLRTRPSSGISTPKYIRWTFVL